MERYSLEIDEGIRTKEQLFARYTDTIFLGYSGIVGWDAFEELMRDCFKLRDINVDVHHKDLSRLSERDRAVYADILAEVTARFPSKLRIIEHT